MKKKSISSILFLSLIALYLLSSVGCKDDKTFVCTLVYIAANDQCMQKQIQAQNEFSNATNRCIGDNLGTLCGHINDPRAKADCFKKVMDDREACFKSAKDKLDAANREAEKCMADNKKLYDDCMNGK